MKRPDKVQQKLGELHELAADLAAPDAEQKVIAALADRSSFVVAAAARIIAEHDLRGHEAALAAAFTRLADGGAAADPTCKAKTAIIETLVHLEVDDPDVYRRGLRIVQMESLMDTAVAVRTGSAAGLAQSGHPSAAVATALLLADPQWDARAGAARALAICPRFSAEPVLMHKLAIGDRDAGVIGECLRALLAMAPDALPVAAERLADPDDEIAEQAAVALGESRLDGAFEALRDRIEHEPGRERRRPLLLAVGLLRRDAAIDYLIEHIAAGDEFTSAAAVKALAIYQDDDKLTRRIREALSRRSRGTETR